MTTPKPQLSQKAMTTPEPSVRAFSRHVQQEGALDLTQGDYKNSDFAPQPEVVRAAQRITRNTVHCYGPAVGRMDVRSEVAEFVNQDGLRDYPNSEVRYGPDEVIFTAGTRAGIIMLLETIGADGTGVVVPRPSWEYDWFVERAGKKLVELHTRSPDFLPDPKELDALLSKGGISSVFINNPHNPTGRVYPKALVEELVATCVKHGVFVLYDSVYQRLDYIDAFVNPAFANPEWRNWVITLSGLSKMDMFGASTGIRACWLVVSDEIEFNGVRAREIIANLSAWTSANPSTLAQDWAVASLQSPLAGLRRPSPYMRERRDYMAQAVDGLKHLGLERTAYEGTFYSPLAFPGLVGEKFERVRHGVRETVTVKSSEDAFDFLLTAGVGGIPFAAFAGHGAQHYGTWQRLSYGSKDVKELMVFMQRVQARIEQQGRLGASAPAARPTPADEVWRSSSTVQGYDALDGLDKAAFEAARATWLKGVTRETLRLTGTKHPDSTAHRAAQLERARAAADGGDGAARRVLAHLEWNPLVEAREEFDETLQDLLGPLNEVLLDFEGRNISPAWLELPEKVVLALLRYGVVPGDERHLLFRVPNPFLEPDEEKLMRLLGSVARANALFLLAAEKLGFAPVQNAIYELSVPQVNARSDVGALVKTGHLYLKAIDELFAGERADQFLSARVPEGQRAALKEKLAKVRLVPLVENVGALSRLPDLLEAFYVTLQRNRGHALVPTDSSFLTRFDGAKDAALVRVFVAMSDTAEQSGKIATDSAYTLTIAGRDEAEKRLAAHAKRGEAPAPKVAFLIGAGRAGFRGGFDPEHEGIVTQFARANGVTVQGIRADAPEATKQLAARFREAVAKKDGLPMGPADREVLFSALEAGTKAHTQTLLRIAPLIAPFGGLVPQTRVRIRATGSANYGRSIPEYPEEWGGGTRLPANRDLRDAWPEGVSLPRAIVYNLGCSTLGLPALTSDLSALDKRTAVLLERVTPGYREILARELPYFVKEAVALVFGRRFADATQQHVHHAAATLWADVKVREELVAPTCLFAMMYLRYVAEDSESWDESKEHESLPTRESELIRDTASGAFSALCSEAPGRRWGVLQALLDVDDANRLLLARELTIEEKREFVDLTIDGWLRTLPDRLAKDLRREWSQLRELGKNELTLEAITLMIANEQLRGSRGA